MAKILDLNRLVGKKSIKCFHRDFDLVKASRVRQRMVFIRMHINRIAQSLIIILKNPVIWRYVIEGFLKAVAGNRNLLRSLEIAVTYRCNSKCEQCSCRLSYDPKRENTEKLTLDEIKGAVDQAVGLGAFQFAINGGEPMLEEEKVYRLVLYIKKHHRRYVHLCTNGILLDENKIKKLKECGLDSLEMGFDSAFKERHDQNRVKGSFDKILENIQNCRKYGIKVILNTILTNDKVKSDDIIYTMYVAKRLGCLLQITPCCMTGAFKYRLDVKLTEDAKLYFYWLLSRSWNNRSDLYSSLTTIKCPAAREKISLQPYGDIVSCALIQISYGNIRNRPLRDIQNEMFKNSYYLLKKNQGCLSSMNDEFIKEYLISK